MSKNSPAKLNLINLHSNDGKDNEILEIEIDKDKENVENEDMFVEENIDLTFGGNVDNEDFHYDSQLIEEPPPKYSVLPIEGVDVRFPYKDPYFCQKTIMEQIIKRVENREHCLVESPTGTGKTAALLCSLLAWQQKKREEYFKEQEEKRNQKQNHCQSPTPKKAKVCENNNNSSASTSTSGSSSGSNFVPFSIPIIYYATRTHTQIAQVIDQLKKSPYNKTRMAVLASRERACVNPFARIPQQNSQTGENTNTFKTTAELINEFCDKKKEEAEARNRNPNNLNETTKQGEKPQPLKSLCSYYNKKEQADFSGLLQKKGQIVDLEDLVKYGKEHSKCPYYGMKKLQETANIVFCTYNHILDQNVRRRSNVEIPGNIFIFDEAHNIENFCQDVGSYEIDQEKLDKVNKWLIKAETDENLNDQVKKIALGNLRGGLKRLSNWFEEQNKPKNSWNFKEIQVNNIENNSEDDENDGKNKEKEVEKKKFIIDLSKTNYRDFVNPKILHQLKLSPKPLKKPEILEIFRKLGLGPEKLKGLWCSYFILLDRHNVRSCPHPACNFKDKDKITTNSPVPVPAPSSVKNNDNLLKIPSTFKIDTKSIIVIKNFLFCLEFFYKTDPENPNGNPLNPYHHFRDYKILLVKEVEKDPKTTNNLSLKFLCLNPGIVFKAMKEAQSVIVASGTLSPLDSFSSELDFDFKQAPKVSHVVPDSNVFSAVITKNGENTNDLDFSWNSLVREKQEKQRKQGYQDDYHYKDLGEILFKICQKVPHGVLIFVPSKTFLMILKTYFVKLKVLDKLKSVKSGGIFFEHELEWGNGENTNSGTNSGTRIEDFVQKAKSNEGAVLFAIIRGRVSEGVDFTNDEARAVVTVGIPNLPYKNEAISAKWEYNEQRKYITGKNEYLDGWNWYSLNGFRALNQAFGRCIRHKADWGGILIVDNRFLQQGKLQQLSDWVKNRIQLKGSVDMVIPQLEKFIQRNHQSQE